MIRNYEELDKYLRYPTEENKRRFLMSTAFTKKKVVDRYFARFRYMKTLAITFAIVWYICFVWIVFNI